MMKFAFGLSAVAVLAIVSGASHADYSLCITTKADVNDLRVGDSVTFDVTLSGVRSDPSTYLSYLEATVGYDNNLFSSNPLVTPGTIVPDTSSQPDILGFIGIPLSNAADGFYEGYYFDGNTPPVTIPISENGVFFSFQVTPLQAGDGSLSFSYAAATLASDAIQTDQFTPDTDILKVHIDASVQGSVVPEPSTFLLLISSMFGLSAGAGLRRLIRRVRFDE